MHDLNGQKTSRNHKVASASPARESSKTNHDYCSHCNLQNSPQNRLGKLIYTDTWCPNANKQVYKKSKPFPLLPVAGWVTIWAPTSRPSATPGRPSSWRRRSWRQTRAWQSSTEVTRTGGAGFFGWEKWVFHIKNGDFPMKNGDLTIKNGELNIKHSDLTITVFFFACRKIGDSSSRNDHLSSKKVYSNYTNWGYLGL